MKTGKISESVLKRSVLRQIKTKRTEVLNGAAVGGDCAIFSCDGTNEEVWVSCMQEAAVAVLADTDGVNQYADSAISIEELLIQCTNNLVTGGATPIAAMITLLLPEWVEEYMLKQLMQEAEATCSKLSVQIAGGQTTVTGAVNTPVAVVTGYGIARRNSTHDVRQAKPGQDIVLSKWIGLQGTAILAKRYRGKLLERYPSYLVEEAAGFTQYLSVLPEAAIAMKSGVCAMHDASEGGIFGALWELAEGAGVGLKVDMKKLPLKQETVEVCEQCNVNPYELLSGGCLIMTTWDGNGLVEALHEAGISAVVIGKLTDSKDRIIVNEEEIRYMDRAKMDEIFRSCN